jgi:FMN phosphatase YigB (HAD superfamily)
MSQLKAVIFDLFGTLTNGLANPERDVINAFNLNKSTDFYHIVEQAICGTVYEDPTSYLDAVIKKLNLPKGDKTRRKLNIIIKNSLDGEFLRLESVEVLKEVDKKGLKLGLISDLPNPDYDIPAKYGFKSLFDAVTYSYETGILKPSSRVFKSTLERLGTEAHQTLMIGNSLTSDIFPAKQLGLQVCLLDSYNQNPKFNPRASNLKEVLNLIKQDF